MEKCAPVSLVKACKLNKQNGQDQTDLHDLIVARDNGRIEIYSYQHGNPFPTVCFEKQIKSTITSIDVGNVTMANSKDILLSCYDGKILALVDSKKFKRQGIMGQENKNEIEDQKGQEKEKTKQIQNMESDVVAMEKELKKLESENITLNVKHKKAVEDNNNNNVGL